MTKLIFASLLISFSAIKADVSTDVTETIGYTPNLDVIDHSKAGLDQLDISGIIDEPGNDWTEAIDIYINGRNRATKSFQGMARKDWAAAGVEDLSIYEAYAALLNYPGDAEPFLDSYNLDALNCNGTFEGHSRRLCDISIKKNLLCTGLQYAHYEGVKAVQNNNEKNWDEMFAFWNGVYDDSVDSRVNKGGPGSVQSSRDKDFGTNFKQESITALLAGQEAFGKEANGEISEAELKEKLQAAFDKFNRANLATFAQATIKYSANYAKEGLSSEYVDNTWGEGYTYFRCGAGLMDPAIAVYINSVFDPRDKKGADVTPLEVHCNILRRMLAEKDIGYNLKVSDLNVEEYFPNVKNDCGIDSLGDTKTTEEKNDDGFMQNALFQELYDLIPGVEQEWLVLLIFGGAAVVALLIIVCLLRCLCCKRKADEDSGTSGLPEYTKESIPSEQAPTDHSPASTTSDVENKELNNDSLPSYERGVQSNEPDTDGYLSESSRNSISV
eukprot:CAMPEP_0194199016 /NCGR_PEP_ID=MMETSP0156-20130528/188_1 /TAXON_ID=33649 /ORGANISM="Thalassionema nitzschioides, Strain L26-B" /LENGTH=498 /DNA_ID=CAMNT_0038923851 /DNA_START=82 /DNA_END=1578 /DNA_ORIENTATION=+